MCVSVGGYKGAALELEEVRVGPHRTMSSVGVHEVAGTNEKEEGANSEHLRAVCRQQETIFALDSFSSLLGIFLELPTLTDILCLLCDAAATIGPASAVSFIN